MNQLLKKIFNRKIQKDPILKVFEKLGHDISKKNGKSENKLGNPIPWFTYPAIEFLNQFDLSNKLIFEWGSGNSSRYFAERCLHIISVEHQKDWYLSQKESLLTNQELIFAEKEQYAFQIFKDERNFDLIVIDGIERGDCMINSCSKLAEDGMIIYDNSDRDPDNCQILRDKGFTQIDFHGFGPINNYTWTTSIFFKKFSLKPRSIQPNIPIGGGY